MNIFLDELKKGLKIIVLCAVLFLLTVILPTVFYKLQSVQIIVLFEKIYEFPDSVQHFIGVLREADITACENFLMIFLQLSNLVTVCMLITLSWRLGFGWEADRKHLYYFTQPSNRSVIWSLKLCAGALSLLLYHVVTAAGFILCSYEGNEDIVKMFFGRDVLYGLIWKFVGLFVIEIAVLAFFFMLFTLVKKEKTAGNIRFYFVLLSFFGGGLGIMLRFINFVFILAGQNGSAVLERVAFGLDKVKYISVFYWLNPFNDIKGIKNYVFIIILAVLFAGISFFAYSRRQFKSE